MAKDDQDLKRHLIEHLGTDALSAPEKSDLVTRTMDVMTWVIQRTRKRYAERPERLVACISSSTVENALAVWSSSELDWIVLSEGLMNLYRDSVEEVARLYQLAFPEVVNTELFKRLQAEKPLSGGFGSALSSLMYFAAIAFYTGHEAGHHLAGHDGHYTMGAHAEQSFDALTDADQAALTRQSLEREADLIGLGLCRRAMESLLGQLWEVRQFSQRERKVYQRVLATLISVGTMTALLKLKPREIEWKSISEKTHPPGVVRAVTLASSISQYFKDNFSELDDSARDWIRLAALELAAGASIQPGSTVDKVYQERLDRGGEPAALRATGIRKALYDPDFYAYIDQLKQAREAIAPNLKPRVS